MSDMNASKYSINQNESFKKMNQVFILNAGTSVELDFYL